MKTKKLKIGNLYRFKWVGSFGFRHTYFGELTGIEKNKLVFDNNLCLNYEDILWMQHYEKKEDLFLLVPKLKEQGKEN